jgi:glutathione S-transferase
MRLHYHPVSTTSRAVLLFAADAGIALDHRPVDLFAGEHLQPAFAALNPNCAVPVLEDGDFRLTESSAILKYLADKADSPQYPRDLQQRARVNERMDWVNTWLGRELGYGFLYPQLFPHHRRQDDATQANTLAWARERARRSLAVLDEAWLGAHNRYLCGGTITLADHFAVALVTLADAIGADYSRWRNLSRWIATMKAAPHWDSVNAAFYGQLVEPLRGKPFEAL